MRTACTLPNLASGSRRKMHARPLSPRFFRSTNQTRPTPTQMPGLYETETGRALARRMHARITSTLQTMFSGLQSRNGDQQVRAETWTRFLSRISMLPAKVWDSEAAKAGVDSAYHAGCGAMFRIVREEQGLPPVALDFSSITPTSAWYRNCVQHCVTQMIASAPDHITSEVGPTLEQAQNAVRDALFDAVTAPSVHFEGTTAQDPEKEGTTATKSAISEADEPEAAPSPVEEEAEAEAPAPAPAAPTPAPPLPVGAVMGAEGRSAEDAWAHDMYYSGRGAVDQGTSMAALRTHPIHRTEMAEVESATHAMAYAKAKMKAEKEKN